MLCPGCLRYYDTSFFDNHEYAQEMTQTPVTPPTVSVLIPARNGEATLRELLAMLSLQTLTPHEVVVADSASTDNTAEVARQYGAGLVDVDPGEFDHGGTRSMLAQRARGDILVFMTQDAVMKTRDALEKLVAPLLEDDEVATSYGRQLPAFDADFFARSLRNFNYPGSSAVRSMADRERLGLKTVFTSNSFACYRRKYLRDVGFFPAKLIFGEDTIVVARLLQKGKKIVYVGDAEVYHSHNYSPLEEFRRYFDIGVLHATQNWFISAFGQAEGQGVQYVRHVLGLLLQEKRYTLLPELLARVCMKYCGYKLGRYYKMLPKDLVPRLSLHRSWWLKSSS